MAPMRRKADLPVKICARCGRPFAWRRKWALNWDAVKYCSKRCGGSVGAAAARPPGRGS